MGTRVLLVEDEKLIRLMVAEVLLDEGFEVVHAETADEAVELIDRQDGVDVVLTDIQLPGRRDGIALARHARARDPGIPVVFVTGRPELIAGAGPLGPADAFMCKPYGPFELVDVLRRLLRRAGRQT